MTWRDGVHLTGTPIWCDARRRRDVCFVSSADRVGRAGHGQLIGDADHARAARRDAARSPRGAGAPAVHARHAAARADPVGARPRRRGAARRCRRPHACSTRARSARRERRGEAAEVRACDALVVAAPFGEPTIELPSVARRDRGAADRWVARQLARGQDARARRRHRARRARGRDAPRRRGACRRRSRGALRDAARRIGSRAGADRQIRAPGTASHGAIDPRRRRPRRSCRRRASRATALVSARARSPAAHWIRRAASRGRSSPDRDELLALDRADARERHVRHRRVRRRDRRRRSARARACSARRDRWRCSRS